MGDYQARFCESLMGRFHWATRRVPRKLVTTNKIGGLQYSYVA